MKDRIGSSPECATCHRIKTPWGRSVPLEIVGSLCNHNCPGYDSTPKPDQLWPGELQSEFGYGCILAPDHIGPCQKSPRS